MRELKEYKPLNLPELSDEELNQLVNLKDLKDEDIDLLDMPEITEEQWKNAHFYYAKSLNLPKTRIHTMIDNDNLEWLQSCGKKGYQTRLNAVLHWARHNGCPIEN